MPLEPPKLPTEFHIPVEPQQKPKPLSFLLVLLAIGLALSPSQAIKALVQLDQPPPQSTLEMALTVAHLAAAGWSVVNLVWLVKRRRRFPGSMIALFVFSILLSMVESGSVMVTDPELRVPMGLATAMAVAIASMWIAYLSFSKHVRDVFVR